VVGVLLLTPVCLASVSAHNAGEPEWTAAAIPLTNNACAFPALASQNVFRETWSN